MSAIGRPSPALVIAVIALIAAVSGTGYAASQSSHSGVEVAKKKKHKPRRGPRGRRGRTGHTGPIGPAGLKGAVGPTGPRGPSDIYVGFGQQDQVSGEQTAVVNVPAGDYLVTGKGVASNQTSDPFGRAACDLSAPGDMVHADSSVSTVPNTGTDITPGNEGTATLANATGLHLPAGGTITEHCYDSSSLAEPMIYMEVVVTATRVAGLHLGPTAP
jgi:hypothetical protein